MSLRPSTSSRGGRNQWRSNGFSNRPYAPATDYTVTDDNNANGKFRPNFNNPQLTPPPRFNFRPNSDRLLNQNQLFQPRGQPPPHYSNPYQQFAPPPLYNQNQQFRRQGPSQPRPQFNPNQQLRPPPLYNQGLQRPSYDQNRQFRPQGQPPPHFGQFRPQQQGFRQRPSRPLDYRNWEHAKPGPPSDCERFTVLSYNILADYLAINHRSKLYFHIPRHILDWEFRKKNIMFELGLWSADILCFQEVDRFQELEEELKVRGYSGIWKMRTGEPVDGCAVFWRSSRFKLLNEEAIEFNKFGLRDNVAQICVLESLNEKSSSGSPPPTCSESHNKVIICNIHVLFNPKRGEIKLGQVRLLLDKAYATSKLWDNAPIVLCGDFNSTPKSPLYNFISDQKLDIFELPRNKISGQDSAEIRPRNSFIKNTSQFSTRVTSSDSEPLDNQQLSSNSLTDTTHEDEKPDLKLEAHDEKCTTENMVSDETVEDVSVTVNEEDSTSFLSELRGPEGTLEGTNGNDSSETFMEKFVYDPTIWTPMEIEAATGNSECTTMEHSLKLKSTYTEVEDCSGTRDSYGEPEVTSYHRAFKGTVDYIWRSEALQTVRVLAPIPKHAMQWTPGFPTKRWGSDHIALVTELAFNSNHEKEQVQ